MQVLLANLELVLERRGLWLTCLFYGVIIGLGVLMAQLREDVGLFSALVAAALPAGWIIAGTQVEVVSKPFSFCLPDNRRNVRRLIFLVGLLLSALAGWALAAGHAMTETMHPAQCALMLCLGLCLALGIYLAGVGLAFLFRNSPMVSAFMGFVVLGLFMLEALHPNSILVLRAYPLPVILAGSSIAIAAWRWLGHAHQFRAHCGKSVFGPLFAGEYAEARRKRQAMAWTGVSQPHPAIDVYFLTIIRSCKRPKWAKYVWGVFYTTLLQMPPGWKIAVLAGLIALACVVFPGSGPSGAWYFIIILPLLAATSLEDLHPSVLSKLPVGSGRREWFYTIITLMVVIAGVALLGVTLTVLILNLLMPWAPAVRIGGFMLAFHRIPLEFLELPVMAFPLLGLASVWLSGRPAGRQLSWAVTVICMLLGSHGVRVPGIPLKAVVVITLVSWLICVLGIRWIVMRHDLVRR